MVGKLFSWLHLSDIHTGHGTARYGFDQKQVWRKLKQDIGSAVESHVAPRPDAIFVTGDIAFSGDTMEYAEISRELLELARELGVQSKSIFTVPGNHDVQRSAGRDNVAFQAMFNGLRKTGDIDGALQEEVTEGWLANRFHNYLDFTRSFAPASNRIWWQKSLKAGRLRVRIVGLNTALLSHDDRDKHQLALGLKQIEETLTAPPTELVILLTHHPLDWLRDGESVKRRLRTLTDIHLHGHVHVAESNATRAGGGSEWLTICAGAVHADEPAPDIPPVGHGYSFGAVGIDRQQELFVDIWPRRWSERHDVFRIDAENADPLRPSTRHKLQPKAGSVLLPDRPKRYAKPADGAFVFHVNDLGPVIHAIDTDTRHRLEAVEEFLRSVADRFRSLFMIDEEHLDLHPLFMDLQGTLESLVPGIVLNEDEGVLRRAQTRHAILRTETMQSILLAVTPGQLRTTGRNIGSDAATDLIKNVLEAGNYIPATAGAFVALWDFWDRTGGWGKLSLQSGDEERGVWNLQISNNFLEVKRERDKLGSNRTQEEFDAAARADLEVTHDLCEFWCGYIHGFLEAALPRIREIMLSGKSDRTGTVFIPAFTRVAGVRHLRANDRSVTSDVFEIQFIFEALSKSINLLSFARERVEQSPSEGVSNAAQAVSEAKKTLSAEIQKVIESIGGDSPRRNRIERMCESPPPTRGWEKFGGALEWIEDANWVIQELSK
jgi:predicted phosphodiesterase